MKITQIYKLNVVGFIVCCTSLFAQGIEHKLSENFIVANDVSIHLNTSHTAIEFETWDKNTVAIEAFIEGDAINDHNRERLLENWRVEAIGTSKEITINAVTGNFWKGNVTSVRKHGAIDDVVKHEEFRILAPMISDMLSPLLKSIENNPMPSALAENLASMNFDAQKFREDEEKYIQQWGDQIKEKFGDDSGNVMKHWTKELSKNTTQLNVNSSTNNSWRGEDFAQQMQAWASQFSIAIENIQIVQNNGSNVMVYRYNARSNRNRGTINRIIKIRMPKASQLKLNVRHGNVKLAEKATNVVASLSHTALIANEINGDKTYIRSSYSPVVVKQWDSGQLVINYVKNCKIQKAKNLRINADSSTIFIEELQGNGAIGGSFGTISIANLSETFSILDVAIENSDFKLKLPDVAYNIAYSGTQSRISIPKNVEASARRNFGNVFVNGFNKTRNTEKVITINSKYSDIILK